MIRNYKNSRRMLREDESPIREKPSFMFRNKERLSFPGDPLKEERYNMGNDIKWHAARIDDEMSYIDRAREGIGRLIGDRRSRDVDFLERADVLMSKARDLYDRAIEAETLAGSMLMAQRLSNRFRLADMDDRYDLSNPSK